VAAAESASQTGTRSVRIIRTAVRPNYNSTDTVH